MEARMNVTVGNRIVVESERVARPPRAGSIEEILHLDPPRYRVSWDDGRTSIIAPTSGSVWIEEDDAEGALRGNTHDSSDLCRSVNERILELEGARVGEYDFICECEDDGCTAVMRMWAQEYEAARSDPNQFAVLPGHERPAFESILRSTERYSLVRKRLTKTANQ